MQRSSVLVSLTHHNLFSFSTLFPFSRRHPPCSTCHAVTTARRPTQTSTTEDLLLPRDSTVSMCTTLVPSKNKMDQSHTRRSVIQPSSDSRATSSTTTTGNTECALPTTFTRLVSAPTDPTTLGPGASLLGLRPHSSCSTTLCSGKSTSLPSP